MKASRITTTLVLLLFAGIVQAVTSLPEQIRSELEDSLYPFARVVPDYKRPATNAPRFAVADFRVSSDELSGISRAISEILRYRIQYVPDVRLYMPAPHLIYIDAQTEPVTTHPLLTSRIAFQHLHKALGIESVLTGSLAFNGKEYALSTELIDLLNDNNHLQRDWHFTTAELPAALIDISKWVYHSLGVDLTPEENAYLEDKKSLRPQAIADFLQHYTEFQDLKGPLKMELSNQLQKQHPEFVLFAIYALQNRVYATNLDEAYTNLEHYKNLRSQHPGNAGVELASYSAMEIDALPKHIVASRISSMKDMAKKNPHDPSIMITLADALVKNGSSLDGITTMLEAVERWPNQYRAWWSLAWALNQHAWQLRGHSMWRDVPEHAKGKFKSLMYLSNLASDTALALNPSNGQLWNLKLSALGSVNGFSENLIEVFDKAVSLAPDDASIYETALNFSSKKWGGTTKARKHIIELAIKNNPEEAWPAAMRNHFMSDFDGSKEGLGPSAFERYLKKVIDHPYTWKLILICIGLILWVAYTLGRKSANEKSDPRDDTSHY